MISIIYNKDGSIKYQDISEWIQKGSNNSNKVFVAIDGYDGDEYTLKKGFILPDGSNTEDTSSTVEEQTINQTNYVGRYFYLTTYQTLYSGNLYMSVAFIMNNATLWTYNTILVINKSASAITSDTDISGVQYASLVNDLTYKEDKYAVPNIRRYTSLTNATSDLTNLVENQVVLVEVSNLLKAYKVVVSNETKSLVETTIDYTATSIEYKNVSGVSQGLLKVVKCSSAEYTALTTKNANTLYIIVG